VVLVQTQSFEFSEKKNLRESSAPLGCLGNENRFQTRRRLRRIQYAFRQQEHLDASIKPLQLFLAS
jgi:hypothetical protein